MKYMNLILSLALIVSIIVCLCLAYQKSSLEAQASELTTQLNDLTTKVERLPDWLVKAGIKCTDNQVPDIYLRDCVLYEVQGY